MSRDKKECRCEWVDLSKSDYIEYHDREWGVPVFNDRTIFEFLTLESAQAGLSWYAILQRRENYRNAFAQFDPEKVAEFDERQIENLMNNRGLIRNRRKIAAAINNARRFLEVKSEFGTFSDYIWRFVEGRPIVRKFKSSKDLPPTTPESIRLSKDLRSRGFQFIGPIICQSHMQATGMFNDHTLSCFRRAEIIENYPKIF